MSIHEMVFLGGVLNSFVTDFVLRHKVIHMSASF